MAYQLKRKTAGAAMKIQIDQKEAGETDGGFQAGGMFFFAGAGEDGDTHQVSEYAAKVIMGDPGMADHFDCTPALPAVGGEKAATKKKAAKKADAAPEPAGDPVVDPAAGGGE